MPAAPENLELRLDKWLWAARFFKTRSLAAQAITGGKVQLDGQRVKPGRRITAGARLEIRRGEQRWEVVVSAVNAHRRPAKEAILLYQETEQSRKLRTAEEARLRQRAARRAHGLGRPTKRQRREIVRFTERDA